MGVFIVELVGWWWVGWGWRVGCRWDVGGGDRVDGCVVWAKYVDLGSVNARGVSLWDTNERCSDRAYPVSEHSSNRVLHRIRAVRGRSYER